MALPPELGQKFRCIRTLKKSYPYKWYQKKYTKRFNQVFVKTHWTWKQKLWLYLKTRTVVYWEEFEDAVEVKVKQNERIEVTYMDDLYTYFEEESKAEENKHGIDTGFCKPTVFSQHFKRIQPKKETKNIDT